MTRYSVISSSAASMKSASSDATSATVDMNMSRPCKGCDNPFFNCMERRWRKHCLHSVIDYFESVGSECITEAGIRETYYKTFVVKIKGEIMAQSGGFYETEENVLIPQCMVEGSLKEAIHMIDMDNPTYHYLMSKRVCDVQRHLYRLKRVWPPQLKQGERIVDQARGIVYNDPFDPNGGKIDKL